MAHYTAIICHISLSNSRGSLNPYPLNPFFLFIRFFFHFHLQFFNFYFRFIFFNIFHIPCIQFLLCGFPRSLNKKWMDWFIFAAWGSCQNSQITMLKFEPGLFINLDTNWIIFQIYWWECSAMYWAEILELIQLFNLYGSVIYWLTNR